MVRPVDTRNSNGLRLANNGGLVKVAVATGPAGPNTVPTDAAIAAAIETPASDTATALTAAIDGRGTSPSDTLPNASGFWWTTEPVAIDGRVYVSTCGDDNDVWLDEWTQPTADGPHWLHRYFLGHVTNIPGSDRDDHQAGGIAIAAGKPVVVFYSAHNNDPALYYRVSDQNVDDVEPGGLTFGPTQVYEVPGDEKTAYAEVMHDGTDIYVCHRTGWGADRWSITKFPAWATGTPVRWEVFQSADQFYVKTRLVSGVIRCAVADHPSLGADNKVWWAEINLTTGSVTKADGTVLGNTDGTNLPLAEASLDLVFTATGSERPWVFDVGHTATREIAFVTGENYPTFATTADYMYGVYSGGAWVTDDIAPVGSFIGGAYFPSIQFIPGQAGQVVIARESGGTDYVEKKVTANNGSTWTTTAIDSVAAATTELTRVFPVRTISGTAPFDYIGTEIDDYPTYNGAWVSRVRPLPRTATVRRAPVTDPPLVAGLRADAPTTGAPAAGLYFPGTSGSYVSGPDVDPPADGVRLEADVALNDWTPAAPVTLLAKEGSASTRQVRLYVAALGKIGVYWSADGSTALNITPNDIPPFTDGQRVQIRADFMPSVNGGTQYSLRTYYRFADDEPWTALATATNAGASSFATGSAGWEVGSRWGGTTENAPGVFYRASVMTLGGDLLAEWRAEKGTLTQKDRIGNSWSRVGDFGVTVTGSPFTSAWNGANPLKLGTVYVYVDANNNMRRSVGAPASDAAGALIGVPPNVSSANLSAIGNAINTTDKYQGKQVYCTSVAKFLHTNGSTAASPWLNPDGTTAFTPA